MKFASACLVVLALVLTCAYGWGANIVTLVVNAGDPVTTETILRAVGIFVAPLGVVMGYI